MLTQDKFGMKLGEHAFCVAASAITSVLGHGLSL
jgi:hypothetical protein